MKLKTRTSIGFIIFGLFIAVGGLMVLFLPKNDLVLTEKNFRLQAATHRMIHQLDLAYHNFLNRSTKATVTQYVNGVDSSYVIALKNYSTEDEEITLNALQSSLKWLQDWKNKDIGDFKERSAAIDSMRFEVLGHYGAIRKELDKLYFLNHEEMKAQTEKDAGRYAVALWALLFWGAICTAVYTVLMVGGYGKMHALTVTLAERLKGLAYGRFDNPLPESRRADEIGELARNFNELMQRLRTSKENETYNSTLAALQIQALIHQSRDGIILLDDSFGVIGLNTIAAEALGLDPKTVQDKQLMVLARENPVLKKINDSLYFPQKLAEPLTITTKSGEKRFRPSYGEIRSNNNSNAVLGYILHLYDITKERAMDSEQQQFRQLIENKLQKSLQILQNNYKLLADKRIGKLNPEQEGIVQSSEQELDKLLAILQKLKV